VLGKGPNAEIDEPIGPSGTGAGVVGIGTDAGGYGLALAGTGAGGLPGDVMVVGTVKGLPQLEHTATGVGSSIL